MEALFTTTGMQIIPYKPSKAGMILKARSVWNPGHGYSPVTAYVMKDGANGKRLVTYRCHPDWLKQNIPGIEINKMPKNNVYEMSEPFALNADIMPNDIQAAATAAILDNNFKTAFFNIGTGVGKTLLSVYLTSLINNKAWVMCYRTIVLEQWVRTITEMTTMNPKKIHIVKTSKELKKMAEGDYDFEKYDLYLSTPKLLTQFAEKYGLSLLNDAFNTCGIGIKFFDEAHCNVGNICKINALTNVERTYYLSADFGQSDPSREKLYYKMFGSVPIIKPKEEMVRDMRYIVGVIVRYNTHPSFNDIESCFGKYGFSAYRYMDYQIEQEAFQDAFSRVLDSIRNSDPHHDYKVLILWNLIEHVEASFDWIKEYYKEREGDLMPNVVRYHSEVPTEEKEIALKEGQVFVTTYQSMSVGTDIKNIRYVISLSPTTSIEDNQASGRSRHLDSGEDCFYFLFCDDGFEYMRKKLPFRIGYLEQQKIKKVYSIKYS